jgi:ABC-type transport system involved in cytochrome c biogenesis permease subunit
LGYANQYASNLVPNKEVCGEFGDLWIKEPNGRIKLVRTVLKSYVQKIIGNNDLLGFDPIQLSVAIHNNPTYWKQQKIIKVDNVRLKQMLGVEGEFVSYNDIYNERVGFKFSITKGYFIVSLNLSSLQKAIYRLEEKYKIFNDLVDAHYLKIFPEKIDTTLQWFPYSEVGKRNTEDVELNDAIINLDLLFNNISRHEIEPAKNNIQNIKKFQQNVVQDLPSDTMFYLEKLIYVFQPFSALSWIYLLLGIVSLIVFWFQKFKEKSFKIYRKSVFKTLISFSIIHLLFIIFRIIVTGHPPFSEGYEILLMISCVSVWLGLVKMSSSLFYIGTSVTFAGLSLLLSSGFSNDELVVIEPYFNSVYFNTHAPLIIIAYSLIGISVVSAIFNLTFMVFLNQNTKKVVLTNFLKHTVFIRNLNYAVLILISLGIMVGAAWTIETSITLWLWEPIKLWIAFTLILGALLVLTIRHNVVLYNIFNIVAFIVLVIAYFEVNRYFGKAYSVYEENIHLYKWPISIFLGIMVLFFGFSAYRWGKYTKFL